MRCKCCNKMIEVIPIIRRGTFLGFQDMCVNCRLASYSVYYRNEAENEEIDKIVDEIFKNIQK